MAPRSGETKLERGERRLEEAQHLISRARFDRVVTVLKDHDELVTKLELEYVRKGLLKPTTFMTPQPATAPAEESAKESANETPRKDGGRPASASETLLAIDNGGEDLDEIAPLDRTFNRNESCLNKLSVKLLREGITASEPTLLSAASLKVVESFPTRTNPR